MIRYAFAVVVAALAAECTQTPAPAPSPESVEAGVADAGRLDASESVYVRACANLVARGCSEGVAPTCAATLQHAETSKLTRVDAGCLATATTKPALRACGFVSCP